jgi:hypothetical protein
MKHFFKHKRGNITLYLVFLIVAIILVLISAVLAPLGVLFNTEMFKAGENILSLAQADIDEIQDAAIKSEINDTITSAKTATLDNISVTSALFKYGWVFILVIIALIIFLFSRRLVEYQTGFI